MHDATPVHPDLTKHLRQLADLLDEASTVAQPYATTSVDGTLHVSWYLNGRGERAEQLYVRDEVTDLLGGLWVSERNRPHGETRVDALVRREGGLRLQIVTDAMAPEAVAS